MDLLRYKATLSTPGNGYHAHHTGVLLGMITHIVARKRVRRVLMHSHSLLVVWNCMPDTTGNVCKVSFGWTSLCEPSVQTAMPSDEDCSIKRRMTLRWPCTQREKVKTT